MRRDAGRRKKRKSFVETEKVRRLREKGRMRNRKQQKTGREQLKTCIVRAKDVPQD